ncbi:DUF4044 domain-containing protein [Lactobacillus sp. ESL0791]|nr:DUF4044 domain-containing protein [Lactobacillus sp. ESL0791]MDF7638800.1 DUF4044 domain-containing protein [Lactobacillus sp. ESL0791]
MARKKKKSFFQRLTIAMAWLMAAITLFGVIASVLTALINGGII